MVSDNEEEPCEICGRQFAHRYLQFHMNTHLGWSLTFIGKSFFKKKTSQLF